MLSRGDTLIDKWCVGADARKRASLLPRWPSSSLPGGDALGLGHL